jgi:oxalate decarboxylase
MAENNGNSQPAVSSESGDRKSVNRRHLLSRSAAFAAALFATGRAGAQNIKNVQQAEHDMSSNDPGPENTNIRNAQPDTFTPPPTDHGEVKTFWNSFSAAHRRVQPGGWSRQVTVVDFPISVDIAGVNMRLTAGGIRELHWHAAAEWAIMLTGKARITCIDDAGRSFVDDVGAGDLWFFPTGTPHSIQGLAPDGCEFLLVFDDGKFSEGDTTLLSDWTRHTPREVLAKNWGVPESALDPVYLVPPDGHYIFQRAVPPALAEDKQAAAANKSPSPLSFSFAMQAMPPTYKTKGGEVRVVDSRNFKVSNTIAAAHVMVRPGAMRELHWHQNADEWQYYIQGKGRMTVFFNGAKARTSNFDAGDVGYIPKTLPHYIENTGDTDLIFLEMFKTDRFEDLSLSDWISHTPPELVIQHLGISRETLQRIPKEKVPVVPA